jgi:signal transduction histidine kinase
MRRQIGWLMVATTSAVVLAFVIPLCLLVRTLAEDRAIANADQEARNVAILVFGLPNAGNLDQLVTAVDQRSDAAQTTVVLADGRILGTEVPGISNIPQVQRAAQGEAFTEVDSSGAQVLVPVVTGSGTSVVRTTVSSDVLHQGVTRAWLSIIALGAALLAIAVLIGTRMGRRISTPVTDLATVAHRLRDGDLDARATPAGPSETQELGVALNLLAQRIVELLAAERAAVGDLSHRLRTPVTALRLDAESISDTALAARLQQHIDQLQRTVDAIIKDAKRPVRSTMADSSNAAHVIRDRVAFWSVLAEDQERTMSVDIEADECRVPLDEADVSDIVDILIDNVFAHTPEGVPFAVTLQRRDGVALLTVEDSGPGMPQDSSEEKPGSSGLGVQIVRRAVAGTGGEVEIDSPLNGGVRVRVTLPIVDG